MDAYRERRAELEAQGKEQGLSAGPIENSGKVSKEDTEKTTVSEASEDTEKTENPKVEEKTEPKKPKYKSWRKTYEGTVPVPEGSSLKFPSAFDKFTVNERIDYYSDLLDNGKITSNKDREVALNAVMGYDKETGKTFTETMKETYTSDISDSFDSLGVAKNGDFYSQIPYKRASKFASKYSEVGGVMEIDFTKEKPVMFKKAEFREYMGKEKAALDEAEELGENLLSDLREDANRKVLGPVAGIDGVVAKNRKLILDETVDYLIEENENYSEDNLDYVQKLYNNYARVNGYKGKKPDAKFSSTGGYRPPSKIISDGIREAIKLNMKRPEGRFYKAEVGTPLGKAVRVISSAVTGEIRVKVPGKSVDIRSVSKGDQTGEDFVSRRIRDNYLSPSDYVSFNPKTGEGKFSQSRMSYASGEGQMTGRTKPVDPSVFKLFPRLPKNYTAKDLERFTMSEIFRHEVYNGKSWKEIK